jgi:hypothetical protein
MINPEGVPVPIALPGAGTFVSSHIFFGFVSCMAEDEKNQDGPALLAKKQLAYLRLAVLIAILAHAAVLVLIVSRLHSTATCTLPPEEKE